MGQNGSVVVEQDAPRRRTGSADGVSTVACSHGRSLRRAGDTKPKSFRGHVSMFRLASISTEVVSMLRCRSCASIWARASRERCIRMGCKQYAYAYLELVRRCHRSKPLSFSRSECEPRCRSRARQDLDMCPSIPKDAVT